MERLGDCMLCGAASREFVPASNTCPTTKAGFCPCGELEQLEGQIRDFLHEALKKRQELRSRVNYIHNRNFQQIPPEIVSHIFLFYLSPLQPERHGGASHRLRASKHRVSGPLILGAVCRKWREIAWSTPQLWISITIAISPKRFPSKLKVAREWLGRSGQLPLSISLSQKNPYDTLTNELLPMVQLLNGYAGRWHSLTVESLSPLLLSAFNVNEPVLQGTFILHTIDIYAENQERPPHLSSFCHGTSQLSPAVVNVYGLQFPSIGIDWSKVTRVEASGFSVDECIELFRRAPILTDCKFVEVGVSDQQQYPLPDGDIIHTSLNSLCLQPDDSEQPAIDTLLRHLTSPSLLELVLGDDEYAVEFSTNTLVSFFSRSSPPLKTLRLMQPFIDHESELIRILETTPAVTHLYISPHYSTKLIPHQLFTRLAESWMVGDHTCEQFLPNLQSLHFSGHYSHPWDNVPNAFGPISEITNPLRRPFVNLLFEWLRIPDQDDYGRIDQENIMKLVALKDAGLDLKIFDSNGRDVDLIEKYPL